MYRKSDAPKQTSILLSASENDRFEQLKKRAQIREERRRKMNEKDQDMY